MTVSLKLNSNRLFSLADLSRQRYAQKKEKIWGFFSFSATKVNGARH